MECAWHLCTKSTIEGSRGPTKFCSKRCKNKYYVDVRRKKLKQMAINYKGGCCSICHYNRCSGALEFHHKDPNEKDFGISSNGHTKSWEKLKSELDKCILVCANCHREIHADLVSLDFIGFSS